jgi:phosphate uptake regulator
MYITDKIACVGRNSLDCVEKSMISLRIADVELAGCVLQENAEIRRSLSEINRLKMGTSNALPIGIITDSISRIGDYAGNIAELAIDLRQL